MNNFLLNQSNNINNHFSTRILDWYAQNKRDLPWRKENLDPYHIVISEIMLQQTQVSKVIEKFKEFTSLFPTIHDLAKAQSAEVIQAWQGLGYNRRAILLHQFAQEICKKYEGNIPQSSDALIKLPGIGPYTAGAISSFAFNRPEPAIDVNVRRIFLRFFKAKDQGLPQTKTEEKKLSELVKECIPENRSRDFHNALMDFGLLICLREKPLCLECPLKQSCSFFPLYQKQKEKVLFVAEKKKEIGMTENGKHVPNRIFRGRIVEFVRQNQEKEILFSTLGNYIKKDFKAEEQRWLQELCHKLQKEGLIKFKLMEENITLSLGK